MDRIPTRNSPYYRPDCRFRQFLEFVNRMFIHHYTLRQIDSVDETLVATRGRTGMIQFIPSKAAKSAVKFWVLAESTTRYILHIKTYLRKTYEPSHTSLQGTYVVKSLDVHVSTHGPWLPGGQGQLFL